ncbi:MAG: hypothetical protein WCT77_10885, partial [Bacteroidota bacterium]
MPFKTNNINIMRFLFVLIVLTFFIIVYLWIYQMPLIGTDDANIFFKYAKNINSGFGMIYNTGGERVEGFTSILWLFVITVMYRLPRFEIFLLAFNILIISYSLYRVVNFIESYFKNKSENFLSISSFLFIFICCFTPGFIIWGTFSLMETGLWSSILILLIITLLETAYSEKKNLFSFSLLLAFCALARPEGMAIGLICSIIYIFVFKNKTNKLWNKNYIPLVVLLTTIVLLTLFRLIYFGYPLPNTYYAKVYTNPIYNLTDGLKYYFSYLGTNVIYFIVLVAVIYVLWEGLKNKYYIIIRQNPQFFLAIVLLILILMPIMEGGDHFDFHRLYVPFLPVFLLILFNTKYWGEQTTFNNFIIKRRISKIVILLILLPSLLIIQRHNIFELLKNRNKLPTNFEYYLSKHGRENGEKLNVFFNKLDSLPNIAMIAVGGFGYSYRGNTYDLVGLNDVETAHKNRESRSKSVKGHIAFSKEVLFNRKPPVFMGRFVQKDSLNFLESKNFTRELEFEKNVLKNIFEDRDFKINYTPVTIKYPDKDWYYETYIENGFAKNLLKCGYTVY